MIALRNVGWRLPSVYLNFDRGRIRPSNRVTGFEHIVWLRRPIEKPEYNPDNWEANNSYDECEKENKERKTSESSNEPSPCLGAGRPTGDHRADYTQDGKHRARGHPKIADGVHFFLSAASFALSGARTVPEKARSDSLRGVPTPRLVSVLPRGASSLRASGHQSRPVKTGATGTRRGYL